MSANENNAVYEIISTSENTNVRFCTIREQGNYVPNHWHRALEIIYMIEGEQTIIVESKPYVLKKGSCIIIDANVIHSTKALQRDAFILLQLPLEFVGRFVSDIRQLTFFFCDGQSGVYRHSKAAMLKRLLERMQTVDAAKKDGFLLHFNRLLFSLMCLLYDCFARRVSAAASLTGRRELSRLNEILAYVMQNYRRVIPLDEIAGVAAFEPKYFCRFFKKHMGITFKEYQNELRLSYIYRDLLDTDDSVAAILERHGFNNYKLFRQMFKERFGGTPMSVRKKIKPKP